MSQFFSSGDQNSGASTSASVLPNEYSGLISFQIDWLDLLAVQGTLRSLLQHHSLKASILWRSAFFMFQLSQLHVDHWEDLSLDDMDLFGRVMSLLFNILVGIYTKNEKQGIKEIFAHPCSQQHYSR